MSSIKNILTNKYVLSIIGSLICLLVTFLYDKFEKKEYSYAVYAKMMILGYIISIATILLFNFLQSSSIVKQVASTNGSSSTQTISESILDDSVKAATNIATQNLGNQDIPLNQLKFKIGTPTF